jgi:hypothetical protein
MPARRSPPLKTRLGALPESALRQLFVLAVDEVPALATWLESHLSKQAVVSPPPKPASTFDAGRWRSDVQRALSFVNPHDWKRPAGADDLLEPLVERAIAVLEQGDPDTALSMLEVLCDEVVPDYEQYEGETELSECLEGVSETMAKAILSAPRAEEVRRSLEHKVKGWQGDLAAYGGDDPFSAVAQALSAPAGTRPARPPAKSTRRRS